MGTQYDLLDSAARLQGTLQAAGFDSIVIGGLAVAIWGEPRLTRDIDLKVSMSRDDASRLLAILPAEYRCLSDEPENTLRQLGFLFVEDTAGYRIDLLLAETHFDLAAMKRGLCIDSEAG